MITLITSIDQTMYATSDLQKCANCSHRFFTANMGGRITYRDGGVTVTTPCPECGHAHAIDYVEANNTIRFSFKSGPKVFNILDVCKCLGCRDGYLTSEVLEMGLGVIIEDVESSDYAALTCPFCSTVSYVPIKREDLQVIAVDGGWRSVAKETDCIHCNHHFAVDGATDHDVSSILQHCPSCGLENWLLAEPIFDSDEYAGGYALTVVTHNAVIFKLPNKKAVITHFDQISEARYAELCQFLAKCEKRANHYYMKL